MIIDASTIKDAAMRYRAGIHTEPTTAEFEAFSAWLDSRWQPIAHMVRFTPLQVDPTQLLIRWRNTSELLISTAYNDSPWLDRRSNARFRAVHDYDHIANGLGFDAQGEWGTLTKACETAPVSIHWILRSEIWFQAAAMLWFKSFQPQKLVR